MKWLFISSHKLPIFNQNYHYDESSWSHFQLQSVNTLFENYLKCHICISYGNFFLFLKLPCLVTLHYPKLQVFKNSPKWTIFGIFNELLSSQKVNESRFARNVEWDFFWDFQTPCNNIYGKLVRCRFCLFQNSQKMRRNLHLISSFFANILIFEAPNAKH